MAAYFLLFWGGDYGRLRLWGSVAFVVGALLSAPIVHSFSPSVVPTLLLIPGLFWCEAAVALLGLPALRLRRLVPR